MATGELPLVSLLHVLFRYQFPLRRIPLFPLTFQEGHSGKSSAVVDTHSWMMFVSAFDKLKFSLLFLSSFKKTKRTKLQRFIIKRNKNIYLKEKIQNLFYEDAVF